MSFYNCRSRVFSLVAICGAVTAATLLLRRTTFADPPKMSSPAVEYGQDPANFKITAAPKGCNKIFKAAESNSVRMTAEMDSFHASGKAITLHLVVENNRKEDLILDHDADANDFYLFFAKRGLKARLFNRCWRADVEQPLHALF